MLSTAAHALCTALGADWKHGSEPVCRRWYSFHGIQALVEQSRCSSGSDVRIHDSLGNAKKSKKALLWVSGQQNENITRVYFHFLPWKFPKHLFYTISKWKQCLRWCPQSKAQMLFCSSKAAVPLLLHLESMVEQDGGSVHKSGLDTSPSCPLLPQPSSTPPPPQDTSTGMQSYHRGLGGEARQAFSMALKMTTTPTGSRVPTKCTGHQKSSLLYCPMSNYIRFHLNSQH